MMKKLIFKAKSRTPILLHNGDLANPLNVYSQRMATLSKKRTKTLEDFREMGAVEWLGSHYWKEPAEQEKTVLIPTRVLSGCLGEAARKHKLGKDFGRSVICDQDAQLFFEGPQDVKERMNHPEFRLSTMVGIQRNKVLRTRPRYNSWEIFPWVVLYENTQVEESQILTIMKTAGAVTGIGDGRSWTRYGRFEIERVD